MWEIQNIEKQCNLKSKRFILTTIVFLTYIETCLILGCLNPSETTTTPSVAHFLSLVDLLSKLLCLPGSVAIVIEILPVAIQLQRQPALEAYVYKRVTFREMIMYEN